LQRDPDLEYTALKQLTEAEQKLRDSGIRLWLAGLNPEPLQLIQRSELGRTLGRERMHFTLELALRAFEKEAGSTDQSSR